MKRPTTAPIPAPMDCPRINFEVAYFMISGTWTMTCDSGPRNGIAQLCGSRYVVAIEAGEGKRLNETFVKWITGGDRLRGSFLFHDSFEFSPTHTPWLATNHKPVIRETARAIWDRIRLVPFLVSFDESEDKDLPEKLR